VATATSFTSEGGTDPSYVPSRTPAVEESHDEVGTEGWCRRCGGAGGLGVAWNTANDAVLAEGRRVLINDPDRLNGVKVIGVDEHVWRHTRRGTSTSP
jgi:hypothetical protein